MVALIHSKLLLLFQALGERVKGMCLCCTVYCTSSDAFYRDMFPETSVATAELQL